MKFLLCLSSKELYSSLWEDTIYMSFQTNCTLQKFSLKNPDNFYEKYYLFFLWKRSIIKKIWSGFNHHSVIPYWAEIPMDLPSRFPWPRDLLLPFPGKSQMQLLKQNQASHPRRRSKEQIFEYTRDILRLGIRLQELKRLHGKQSSL